MKPPTVTCPARTYGKASTLIPLSSVRSMPPTSYRASSRNGDGIGMGLVIPRNNYGAFSEFLTFPLVPQRTRPVELNF